MVVVMVFIGGGGGGGGGGGPGLVSRVNFYKFHVSRAL